MNTFFPIELDELDPWSDHANGAINTLLPAPATNSNATASGWLDYIRALVLSIWSRFSSLWTITLLSVRRMSRAARSNLTAILCIHAFCWWLGSWYIAIIALDPSYPSLFPRRWLGLAWDFSVIGQHLAVWALFARNFNLSLDLMLRLACLTAAFFIAVIVDAGGWPAFIDTVLHQPFSPPINGPIIRLLATFLLGFIHMRTYRNYIGRLAVGAVGLVQCSDVESVLQRLVHISVVVMLA